MTKILTLNHFQQTTEFTCGPSTLITFLDYHDKKLAKKFSEKKLTKILQTCPVVGTTPENIYNLLAQTGKPFEMQKGITILHLEKYIMEDHPSIVLWNDGEEWHWSNVVGFDQSNIILLDPYLQDGFNVVNKEVFNQSWSRLAIK